MMDWIHVGTYLGGRAKLATYYWVDMSTRCLTTLGLCSGSVVVHGRLAPLQLEHGSFLSHRIYSPACLVD
jgi:hypothetical protein